MCTKASISTAFSVFSAVEIAGRGNTFGYVPAGGGAYGTGEEYDEDSDVAAGGSEYDGT